MNTILQVPISKQLRDQAASSAHKMGFSSLQETVRVFLRQLAEEEIKVRFEETVKLSPKAIKRYNKMIDEIEQGKVKMKSFSDVK
ncbi:hypothetical protein HYU45_00410 [Candidatus Daviesbacteria bacterium]|nr:hypothetical protein [Candidatus Daviesbacteria bacterium]